MLDPDLVNALIGLASTVGVKAVAELISSWRIAKRLERIEQSLQSLPAVAAQVETTQQELTALSVRVGVLEDFGPVLR